MVHRDLKPENVRWGRCTTLTPPDPWLKGAWYPGGFKPRTYQVKTRFQNATRTATVRVSANLWVPRLIDLGLAVVGGWGAGGWAVCKSELL
jgi:hypothetical protein